jgi:predicted GTPase
MSKTKVLIMGAAGRDFHNFNTIYRDNDKFEVICFTATQIPNIEGRVYPGELAGKLYPKGIPIYSENDLVDLIKKHEIDEVVFSYSDVSSEYVMNKCAIVNAAGASFILLSPEDTMIKSTKPVIAVVAVRTGCGKSQTSRKVCQTLISLGLKVAAIRHPMPYGDLVKQKVQRFASLEDLKIHKCTIEEMEEYEPHIVNGTIIYSGVDYEAILREAEKEADVIVWDGGNNDTSFYKPDLTFTVVDPHRPGHELSYYPGATNTRLADVIVVNKIDTAEKKNIELVIKNVKDVNPDAVIMEAYSPVSIENLEKIRGKRVLVVEDGPTLTHGGMAYGAGMVAAGKYEPAEIIDPRPFAVKSIADTYKKYPSTGALLPAMGYGESQLKDLEDTIASINCDTVIIGTPIDLRRVIKIKQDSVRVTYDLAEKTKPDIKMILTEFINRMKIK